MSRVVLVKCEDVSPEHIDRLMQPGGGDTAIRRGAKVFIKPNLHGGHGHTSPAVIEAVCRWAYEQGAGHVCVGDGPYWGKSREETDEYFRQTGLYGAAERSGAEPVNLHTLPYRTVRPGSPALPDELGLTSLLFDSDVVINLPLLKTHFYTLVTLGIKNLKGCIRPEDKRRFHEMELNAAISELCRLIAPKLTTTVLDATTAIEGMGPSAGTELQMGLLAASSDIVALDSVACSLAGIDPGEVRIIRQCARMGIGRMDLDKIEVTGEDPAEHRRRFRRPHEEVAKHFPDLVIEAEGACSGCAMNLFEALSRIRASGEQLRVPAVVIGTRGRLQAGLAVGDCARKCGDGCQHLPGCPPLTGGIRRALLGE